MNGKTLRLTVVAIAATSAASQSDAANFSGTISAYGGNNGNPVYQTPIIPITGLGSFDTGVLIAPDGAAAAGASLVSSMPSISVDATASDIGTPWGSGANAVASMSYSLVVAGSPGSTGVAVPLVIEALTSATSTFSGSAARNANYTGTSLDLVSANVVSSLHDIGSTGTVPTLTTLGTNNPNGVSFGWGQARAFVPIPGYSYSAYLDYGFTALAGSTITIRLLSEGQAQVLGGVNSVASSGTALASINPYLAIDPTFLQTHPGFSIMPEAGFGNLPPVPEPSSLLQLAAGLGVLSVWRCRRWQTGRGRTGDAAKARF